MRPDECDFLATDFGIDGGLDSHRISRVTVITWRADRVGKSVAISLGSGLPKYEIVSVKSLPI